MSLTQTREEIAFHEAGHGVVAAMLGGLVQSVDIHDMGPGNRTGLIRWRAPDTFPLVHRLAVSTAGSLSIWETRRRKGPRMSNGSAGDMESMAELLAKERGRSVEIGKEDEFYEGMDLAKEILGDHWGAVQHIAERLLSHTEVPGALAHAIVDKHKAKSQARLEGKSRDLAQEAIEEREAELRTAFFLAFSALVKACPESPERDYAVMAFSRWQASDQPGGSLTAEEREYANATPWARLAVRAMGEKLFYKFNGAPA